MPRRVPSPAPSENEVDILDSLVADNFDDAGGAQEDGNGKGTQGSLDLDFGSILNRRDTRDGNSGGDDDEDFIASAQRRSNRKTSNLRGKTGKKGGGFQAMGLSAHLLRSITRKGFAVPTPIQRKTIPLILDGRDVVGMARTGSGKTAAFVVPMIEKLRAHNASFGARALVLSPSRELALQTLKVVKEFGRGTDLKCVLLVGGDSLEEQFGLMATNPDIVIATPGRFMHLKIEMSLDLSSIRYVVFDEADRLFEMGFAAQLTEILHALPASRQTLLFSATLPTSLVEFAKAGLQDPSLVRLDAETKVSPDLQSAFFTIKGGDKEGALLHILYDVIKMPLGRPGGAGVDADAADPEKQSRKRKRGSDNRPSPKEKPTEYSTVIFTATKHHVEFLTSLLQHAGFAVSMCYGSLDQTARRNQVEDFRRGLSHILVVTDVAARGIDIPVLANVINYDFAPSPKLWVHRVGRTARAGQSGWAYSLLRESDAPYLIDLQLFLGRKLAVGDEGRGASLTRDVVVGALRRSEVESNVEWVNKVLQENIDISTLRAVTTKAERLYMRTRNSASAQSAQRAREIVRSKAWSQLHALFGDEEAAVAEQARSDMLAKISSFRPQETVFELGPRGKSDKNEAAEVARNLRSQIAPIKEKKRAKEDAEAAMGDEDEEMLDSSDEQESNLDRFGSGDDDDDNDDAGEQDEKVDGVVDGESDDEEELEITVSGGTTSKKGQDSFQDSEVYMSYAPRTTNFTEERGYGVHSGSQNPSFAESARDLAMNFTNDDGAKTFGVPTRARMRWDKKQSKYVSRDNDTDGSRGGGGGRMIRGESGVKIAASFKSGRFDKWRRAQRLGKMPQVGEAEKGNLVRAFSGGAGPGAQEGGPRYKHKQEKAPKEADKFRDDYHVRKRRVAEAKEKRVGKYRDGEGSSRRELKSTVDIRKARELKEQRKAKNARPAKRGKR